MQYMRLHKASPGTYEALVRMQGNKCAICEKPPTQGKRLNIDHDHSTGKIRALLCMECNMGLGRFHDDINVLGKAIVYLTVHGSKSTAGLKVALGDLEFRPNPPLWGILPKPENLN